MNLVTLVASKMDWDSLAGNAEMNSQRVSWRHWAQEACCQGVGVRNDPVTMKGSTFSSQGYSFFQIKVTTKVENRPVPSKPTKGEVSQKVYRDCLKFMRFGLVKWHWYLLSASILDFPLQLEASLQVKPCKGNSMFNKQVSRSVTTNPKHLWKINIFSLVEDFHHVFFAFGVR